MITSVLFIITFYLLLSLGYWQLQRAEYKQYLLDRVQLSQNKVPIALTELVKQKDDINDTKVKASGYYLNRYQFFLDNRIHQGKAGYEVITPLLTKDQQIVLVNRGWVPIINNRDNLPYIEAVVGFQQLLANVKTLDQQIMVLKEDSLATQQWPMLIQKVDIQQIQLLFSYPVLPMTIRLQKDQTNGFVRNWKTTTMSPERHYAYSFQWFSLAICLLIIYITVNTKTHIIPPNIE